MMQTYYSLEQLVPSFFLAGTLILAWGTVLLFLAHQPAARQRIGELTVLAVFVWLLMAVLPWRAGDGDASLRSPAMVSDRTEVPPTTQDPGALDAGQPAELAMTLLDTSAEPSQASVPHATGTEARDYFQIKSRSLTIPAWLTRIYVAGAGLLIALMVAGKLMLVQTMRSAAEPPAWLLKTYAAMPGSRKARIVLTRRGLPFSCGLWRPTIAVPQSLVAADATARLHAVLLHEQAHVERFDAYGHTLLNLALPLLYFHPLYWLLRKQTLFARERVADSWASQWTDRIRYVESLTELVRERGRRLLQPVGVMGMSNFRSSFCRRMDELMRQSVPLATNSSSAWNVAAIVMLMSAAVVACFVWGQPIWAEVQEAEPIAVATAPQEHPQDATPETTPTAASSLQPVGPAMGCFVRVDRMAVFAPLDGMIEDVVKAGQHVKQGDVIVAFDDAEAQAQLDELHAKCETEEVRIQSNTEIRLAEARLQEREAELREVEQSLAKLPRAEEEGALLACQARIRQAMLGVERADNETLIANNQLSAMRQQMKLVQSILERHQVQAAHDGVIVDQRRAAGQHVGRGEQICSIQPMNQLTVVAEVPLQEFHPDCQQVRVVFERGGKAIELEGNVIVLDPQVSIHGTITLTVAVKNPRSARGDWLLLPGMSGQLTCLIARTASARTTSDTAVAQDRAQEITAAPDEFQPQETEVHLQDVAALEELVAALTQLRDQTRARYEGGTIDAHRVAKIETELDLAKGRLAEAQGDFRTALASYESAMVHVEQLVTTTRASMQAGVASLETLVDSLSQRARTKDHVLRVEQRLQEIAP